LAAEEPNGYDPDSLADVDKVSRCAVAKLQGAVFRSVFDNLCSDPRTQFHAASLLSQANEHSGKWLTASSSLQHRGGTQLTAVHWPSPSLLLSHHYTALVVAIGTLLL
jgi:hypothetical protein